MRWWLLRRVDVTRLSTRPARRFRGADRGFAVSDTLGASSWLRSPRRSFPGWRGARAWGSRGGYGGRTARPADLRSGGHRCLGPPLASARPAIHAARTASTLHNGNPRGGRSASVHRLRSPLLPLSALAQRLRTRRNSRRARPRAERIERETAGPRRERTRASTTDQKNLSATRAPRRRRSAGWGPTARRREAADGGAGDRSSESGVCCRSSAGRSRGRWGWTPPRQPPPSAGREWGDFSGRPR
jgi:hypothetical protein